jgi:hypothetical protein
MLLKLVILQEVYADFVPMKAFITEVDDEQLDCMVASRILAVSHSHGTRTMHGLLSADGVHVSVDRVGRSLQ